MLITGANGMLGKTLSRIFPDAVLLKGKKDLDLTNTSEVEKYFSDKNFDIIIHCAAFTNLEYCENHPKASRVIHSEVVDIFSRHCYKLIYISTNPSNSIKNYYLTKHEGEIRTLLNGKRNLVIKTNIYGKGGLVDWAVNELKNNKNIKGYNEVHFNAIHVQQLANFIKDNLHLKGRINIAGDSIISKYEFLVMVSNYLGLDMSLIQPQSTPKDDLSLSLDSLDFSCTLFEGLDLLKKDYE